MKQFIISILLILFSTYLNAEIIYPEYVEEKVLDLSKKFDSRYLNKLKNDLINSQIDIRIVFIRSENKINLGIYAAKLFEKWKMTDNSILVVIDPFTNKRGFAIGKSIKENLKNRKKIEDNKREKDILENDIDYNNLVDVINNKFSPDSIVTYSNKKQKNTLNQKESVNSVNTSNDNNNFNDLKKTNIKYSNVLKNLIFIIFVLGISYLLFFIYKKKEKQKKNIEIKNNLSFEASIKLQEISDLIETLNQDLESYEVYKGMTISYLQEELNKIKRFISDLQKIYQDLSEELENICDENIDNIYRKIDDFSLLQANINDIHISIKEKIKQIKKIIKNSSENISNIRIYLENNLRLVDDTSKIYNLELSFIKEKLSKIKDDVFNINMDDIKYDPIFFREKISELENNLIQIKKDIDVIPHIFSQLNNQITDIISQKKLSNNLEIIKLKEKILKILNYGDMKKSSELLNELLKNLNEYK
jgi:hypothetical protein